MTHSELIKSFLDRVARTAPEEMSIDLNILDRVEYLRTILAKSAAEVDQASPTLFGRLEENPFTGLPVTPLSELATLQYWHVHKIEAPGLRAQLRHFIESVAREADVHLTAQQLADIYNRVEHPTFPRPKDMIWGDYWEVVERHLKEDAARRKVPHSEPMIDGGSLKDWHELAITLSNSSEEGSRREAEVLIALMPLITEEDKKGAWGTQILPELAQRAMASIASLQAERDGLLAQIAALRAGEAVNEKQVGNSINNGAPMTGAAAEAETENGGRRDVPRG